MSSKYKNSEIMGSRTLHIGDLEAYMDESYIASLFRKTGGVVNVKIIKSKITGQPQGYGFVEFTSHELAEKVLSDYNGKLIPGSRKTFRLNWGIYGGGSKSESKQAVAPGQKLDENKPDFSIYVGDLDRNVTDKELLHVFVKKYPSVISARIIVDPATKLSKGYGFVKFTSLDESNKAIMQMRGHMIRGKYMEEQEQQKEVKAKRRSNRKRKGKKQGQVIEKLARQQEQKEFKSKRRTNRFKKGKRGSEQKKQYIIDKSEQKEWEKEELYKPRKSQRRQRKAKEVLGIKEQKNKTKNQSRRRKTNKKAKVAKKKKIKSASNSIKNSICYQFNLFNQ